MKRFGTHFADKANAIEYAKRKHFRYVYQATDEHGVWFFAWPSPAYNLPVIWQGW